MQKSGGDDAALDAAASAQEHQQSALSGVLDESDVVKEVRCCTRPGCPGCGAKGDNTIEDAIGTRKHRCITCDMRLTRLPMKVFKEKGHNKFFSCVPCLERREELASPGG